jgi:hypothetical protein
VTRVWVKLDATYVEDEKVMAAGALAELVFIRSIAYCRRRVTDGFISSSAVRSLTLGVPDAPEALVEALVVNELWDVCAGGWTVRNYEVWQQTKAKLAEEAARKRTEREERKKERDIARTSTVRPADTDRTPYIDTDYVKTNVASLRARNHA